MSHTDKRNRVIQYCDNDLLGCKNENQIVNNLLNHENHNYSILTEVTISILQLNK